MEAKAKKPGDGLKPKLKDKAWRTSQFSRSLRSGFGEKMSIIKENYQRITDDRRSFDIRFWQSQGDRAIFQAVSEMLHDYFMIRGKDADELRLQRTVENFRKA